MSTPLLSLFYATRGGMLTVLELRLLAETAAAQGDCRLHLTERLEVELRGIAYHAARRLLERPGAERLREGYRVGAPGVVTTASALGLPGTRAWLTPGVLSDAVAALGDMPDISVSLCDASQTCFAALVSRVNFIASSQRDLWHVHTGDTQLPGAIRTQDLARAAQIVAEESDIPGIAARLAGFQFDLEAPALTSVLHYTLPVGALIVPAFGGGISARFLVDLCVLLAEKPEASITLTPWRELCVRNLDAATFHRLQHSMVRWRVPAPMPWQRVYFDSALAGTALRIHAALSRACPSDAGLSWALVGENDPLPEAHFVLKAVATRRWQRARFDLFAREGLCARTGAWRVLVRGVRETALPGVLLDALRPDSAPRSVEEAPPAAVVATAAVRHACGECLTEYSAAFGDPTAEIAAGTAFGQLPASWCCPVCGAAKARYGLAA